MTDKILFVTHSLKDTSSKDLEGVGALRWHGDRLYRWVQNKHTDSVTEGQVVSHSFDDGDQTKVYRPTTANLSFIAGVVMAKELEADHYGWIQVLGVFDKTQVFQSETTAWTPGVSLKGVNDQLYLNMDTALGTAPTAKRTFLLLETVETVQTAGSGPFKVYISAI